MRHVVIFVGTLIFTMGFTVVYQGFQTYRGYRFPAVRAFVLYTAAYNLVGLLTLTAQYLLGNVGSLSSDGMYILVIIILGSLGFCLAAIEVILFATAVWHLSGMTRTPRWFVYAFGVLCIVWFSAFVAGSYRFFHLADRQTLLGVHIGIVWSLFALDFLLPLFLLVRARLVQPERHRRMARNFSLFFLSLACLEIGGMLIPSQGGVAVAMLPGLLLNIGFLIYFKSFVTTYYGPLVSTSDPNLRLESLCAEFHLSARERDIVQMILNGLSNKEIERDLFISSHTVKNHIYHIFQKTGAKSRSQLISMIVHANAASMRGSEL